MDYLVDQPVSVKQRTVSTKTYHPKQQLRRCEVRFTDHQVQSFTIFRHSYITRHQPNDSVLATCF